VRLYPEEPFPEDGIELTAWQGDPITLTHAAIWDEGRRRTWRERLFSWPWRPWMARTEPRLLWHTEL
jgi:hypothetical protein